MPKVQMSQADKDYLVKKVDGLIRGLITSHKLDDANIKKQVAAFASFIEVV